MNKQVNRVTNAIADDIRSHERSQKIYSLCFLAVLLLPLLLVFVSYVLGAHQLPSLAELVPSKLSMLSIVGYVSTVTLVYTILFLNKRMTVCLKVYSVTIDELLDECVELQEKLDESERELEKAKALAERYWKMLSGVQRDTEESLKIANSNRVQHTSGR